MNQVQTQIHVTLPDGSVRDFPAGATPFDVANSISPRLAAASLVARIRPAGTAADATPAAETTTDAPAEAAMYAGQSANEPRMVDMNTPLAGDVALELITDKNPDALKVLRHSTAHVMATAVLELFPETKLGHGPATDSGFFYDFYRPTPFTPDDFEKIEKKMAEIIARDEPFVHEFVPRDEGIADFKAADDFMKLHFIERFTKPGEDISLYRNGEFVDFCRGPHVPSTGRIKAFRLQIWREPTGWATKRIRSCSGFTGLRSSRRRTSTRTSSTWKRSRRAITAPSANSWTCFPSRKSLARDSSSGIPRAA